jgi:hypothetical protein
MRNATHAASRPIAPGAACASPARRHPAVEWLRGRVVASPLTAALVAGHLVAGIWAPAVLAHGLALLVAGRLLERALGAPRFAAVYVGAIVVSSNLNQYLGWEWRGAAAAGLYGVFGALLTVTVSVELRRALLVWVFMAAAVLRDLTLGGSPSAFLTSHVASLALGALAGIFLGAGAEIRSPAKTVIGSYTPAVQGGVRVRRARERPRFWRRDEED